MEARLQVFARALEMQRRDYGPGGRISISWGKRERGLHAVPGMFFKPDIAYSSTEKSPS